MRYSPLPPNENGLRLCHEDCPYRNICDSFERGESRYGTVCGPWVCEIIDCGFIASIIGRLIEHIFPAKPFPSLSELNNEIPADKSR